jgi:lysozyme
VAAATSNGDWAADAQQSGRTSVKQSFIVSVLALASVCAQAQTNARVALTDEPSRQELARYAAVLEGSREIPRKFEFPKHVVQGKTFGIDVSHYQGSIKWTSVAGQGVSFAYVKASQGRRAFDGRFAENWKAVKSLDSSKHPIRRGAYHFMTAKDSPEEQANNFIATVGALSANDLPPCLDIEWDFRREGKRFSKDANGRNIDEWGGYDAAEIVRRAKVWLDLVEKATGKRPVIYTNATWWRERIGADVQLASYKLWISDYSSASLNQESPRVPKDFKWALWQLTDTGMVKTAGLVKGLDTNLLAPDAADLATLMASPAPR